MASDADTSPTDTLTLTAEIVASYLGNAAHVSAAEIPAIIRNVRAALSEGSAPAVSEEAAPTAAPKMHSATVKKSITPDALISFIDNKPYKTLKRHLSRHGHDIKSYKEAYGLPKDYPSVAPNYSAARSEMAKRLGLGARGGTASAAPADVGQKTAAAPKAASKPARKKAEPAASSAPAETAETAEA